MAGGTAQKSELAIRDGSVAEGVLRRIVSVSPRAVTPDSRFARPAEKASAPAMSPIVTAAYDPVRGSSPRSSARRKAAAVTGALDGGENRNPGRTWNVYVRPPSLTTGMDRATSGRSRAPAGNGSSG